MMLFGETVRVLGADSADLMARPEPRPRPASLPLDYEMFWLRSGEIVATERLVVYPVGAEPACLASGHWSEPMPVAPGLFIRTRVTLADSNRAGA